MTIASAVFSVRSLQCASRASRWQSLTPFSRVRMAIASTALIQQSYTRHRQSRKSLVSGKPFQISCQGTLCHQGLGVPGLEIDGRRILGQGFGDVVHCLRWRCPLGSAVRQVRPPGWRSMLCPASGVPCSRRSGGPARRSPRGTRRRTRSRHHPRSSRQSGRTRRAARKSPRRPGPGSRPPGPAGSGTAPGRPCAGSGDAGPALPAPRCGACRGTPCEWSRSRSAPARGRASPERGTQPRPRRHADGNRGWRSGGDRSPCTHLVSGSGSCCGPSGSGRSSVSGSGVFIMTVAPFDSRTASLEAPVSRQRRRSATLAHLTTRRTSRRGRDRALSPVRTATIAQRCGDTRPATLEDVAGYRGLAAAGRSIVDLLNRRIAETLPAGPRPTAVMAGTVDFDQVNSSPVAVIRYPAISLYCYKVTRRPGDAAGMVGGRQRRRDRAHPAAHAPDDLRLGHGGGERAGVAGAGRADSGERTHPDRSAAASLAGTGNQATWCRSCRTTSPWSR